MMTTGEVNMILDGDVLTDDSGNEYTFFFHDHTDGSWLRDFDTGKLRYYKRRDLRRMENVSRRERREHDRQRFARPQKVS